MISSEVVSPPTPKMGFCVGIELRLGVGSELVLGVGSEAVLEVSPKWVLEVKAREPERNPKEILKDSRLCPK